MTIDILNGSFTDGKPRVATKEDCEAAWAGRRDNSGFRCRMCGFKFKEGDIWRFVYANFAGSPSNYGNFLVCQKCDGSDILDRASLQEKEAHDRFWWLRPD
jgi:hypothetical protein